MTHHTRTETITAHDGGSFDAYTVVPESGSGDGIVLVHEAFGLNDYTEETAERLAGLGYVVIAPDYYWRLEPGLSLPHDDEGIKRAVAIAQQLDRDRAVQDLDAALAHLRTLNETKGKVGVFGFCLGGTLAYLTAARSDPDVAVCYYGSGVHGALDLADKVTCPALFHFGGSDPHIPDDKVQEIHEVLGARENVEFHIHEGAGHAFDNHKAPMYHNARAKAQAWEVTTDFLQRKLRS